MPTKVKIDGIDYEVPRMKFKQLKTIWPRMKDTLTKMIEARKAGRSADGVTQMFDAVEDATFVLGTAMARMPVPAGTKWITAEGEEKELTRFCPEWVEDMLDPDEAQELPRIVQELMLDTGLIKAGKVDPSALALIEEQVMKGSTETGTPSSLNS